MSAPHRGIAALLQKAADEKQELEKSERWMRAKTKERLAAASEEAEAKSARAAYRRQLAEGEKQQRVQESIMRKEKETERRRQEEKQEERTARELDRLRCEEDKENRLKQKVLANR